MTTCKQELAASRLTIVMKDEMIEALIAENLKLKTCVEGTASDRTTDQLKAVRKDCRFLNLQLEDMLSERGVLEDEIQSLTKHHNTVRHKLDAMRNDHAVLKSKLKAMSKDRRSLKDEIDRMLHDRDVLKDQMEGMVKERNALRDQLDGMRNDRRILHVVNRRDTMKSQPGAKHGHSAIPNPQWEAHQHNTTATGRIAEKEQRGIRVELTTLPKSEVCFSQTQVAPRMQLWG